MADILLTSDRTLISDYHKNLFFGFGTCAPSNFIPDWLFKNLFFPPLKNSKDGSPYALPYGLRKLEAQLLKENFNVTSVSPQHLGKQLKNVAVLGIHVMDPFGLGPASSTLSALFKKKSFLSVHFERLMMNPDIKAAKRDGLKVIVGGPGVWQFKYRPQAVKDFGIDCIVEGEAEKVIGQLINTTLQGETLPQWREVGIDEIPTIEEIPNIIKPSIEGIIEIGRGCCRRCQFCNVTLRPLRWYPIDKIEQELIINANAGQTNVCIHAEDVMLYSSNNTTPNPEKLLKLHKMVVKHGENIAWSHCSIAATASAPKLFHELAEIIMQKQAFRCFVGVIHE